MCNQEEPQWSGEDGETDQEPIFSWQYCLCVCLRGSWRLGFLELVSHMARNAQLHNLLLVWFHGATVNQSVLVTLPPDPLWLVSLSSCRCHEAGNHIVSSLKDSVGGHRSQWSSRKWRIYWLCDSQFLTKPCGREWCEKYSLSCGSLFVCWCYSAPNVVAPYMCTEHSDLELKVGSWAEDRLWCQLYQTVKT